MADLHKTRHQLCNKRTGTRPTTTNTTKPTQGETPFTIPQGNTTLQDDPEDNAHATNKGTHRPQHLCRCRLGRMPKRKKINKWIHSDNDGISGTMWKQNTSSSSIIISRVRAICSWHRSTRRTTYSKLHQGSHSNKGEHTHTHRQHKRQKHCNKNRLVKESKRIDLKYLFIQQLVQSGVLSIHKTNTHDNPADILTKYVSAEVLNKHLYMAGIQCPQHHN